MSTLDWLGLKVKGFNPWSDFNKPKNLKNKNKRQYLLKLIKEVLEGNNQQGLGHAIARAISEANINLAFFMAQVVGKRYSAIVGLETGDDARKVSALIRRATTTKPRRKRQYLSSPPASWCGPARVREILV